MIEARKQRVLEGLFALYTRRLLRSHFSALRLQGGERVNGLDRSMPLILFGNHSCWWDGLIEFYLAKKVFSLNPYLMMEEKQLKKYLFFRRFGAFSVNRQSPRESLASIQYAVGLFREPNRVLIMYPQGVMKPNDARPLGFSSGIGRITAALGKVHLIPIAHRYEFLTDQRPEALVAVGEPLLIEDAQEPKRLTVRLEAVVTELLDSLRSTIVSGRFGAFMTVLTGKASTSTRYDGARILHLSQ